MFKGQLKEVKFNQVTNVEKIQIQRPMWNRSYSWITNLEQIKF